MKLTRHSYPCNSLTNFECDAHATTGNGKCFKSTKQTCTRPQEFAISSVLFWPPFIWRIFWRRKIQLAALSFYRSQNVLCWSKCFVSDQKFIYILCQAQTFCARQKDDLHSVKLVFVPTQKFLKRLTQKIWTGTKHFATCKRTRQ